MQFSDNHFQFSFDTLQVGDTLRHTFTFKNAGNTGLAIDTIATNCDCASSYFSNKSISPGETDTIEVSFVPRDSGYAVRRYVVKANTDSIFHVLTLEGYVK